MKVETRSKVRDIFSKYGFFELLGIESGNRESSLVKVIAFEMEQRRNFPDFRDSIKSQILSCIAYRDCGEMLDEMSKDLHY